MFRAYKAATRERQGGGLAGPLRFFSGAHQGHKGTVNYQNQQDLVGTQNPQNTGQMARIRWNGWDLFLLWEQGVAGSNPVVPTR